MMRRTALVLASATVITATAGIGATIVRGQSTSGETVFVPIVPCRLVDTRPATNTGPRSTKVGPDETVAFNAHDGNDADSTCAIPATATAVAANVTVIQPTERSFLTLWPADAPNPGTSNLNYVGGQAPTPNAANIPIAPNGAFNVFNAFGETHFAIDVNGYFQPSSAVGAVGPAGADGPDGSNGAANRISDEAIARNAWYENPGAAATIPNADAPVGIATDGTHVFVTNPFDDSVNVIDPVTNVVIRKIPVGAGPSGIIFDGDSLFVSHALDDTLVEIDPVTYTKAPPLDLGAGLGSVGLAAARGRIYVAHRATGQISVVDASTMTLLTTINGFGELFDVEYDGRYVFATEGSVGTGKVNVIDPATNTVVGSPISTGRQPQGLAHTGTALYVANTNQNTISVIDPVRLTTLATVTLGFSPVDVAYDGKYIYVVDNAGGAVNVLDLKLNLIAGRPIPVGLNPNRIVFDGTNLFVTNFGDGTVSKILPI